MKMRSIGLHLDSFLKQYILDFKNWVESNYCQLAVFNVILIFLLLLRSSGYFEPSFPMTINSIMFIAFLLSILLLSMGSKFLFCVTIIFWVFAGFLKIFGIEVWAERTSIYSYQSLLLAVVMLIIESIRRQSAK